LQAEPIWLQRPDCFQSLIDAPETIVQRGSQQVPRSWRLIRVSLPQYLNTRFSQDRIGHRGPFSLPFQHQAIPSWTAARFWWRSAAAIQAKGHMLAFSTVLNIQDSNILLPHMQGIADVEELFLQVQLEFV
jgi:hypothetical protein